MTGATCGQPARAWAGGDSRPPKVSGACIVVSDDELSSLGCRRRNGAEDLSVRVFLAGATGAIGAQLVPRLVAAGHVVGAMTRSERKSDWLRALGAEPIVCDVFDAAALATAVAAFAPGTVIHELTDLPQDPAEIPTRAAANDRIRREGTRNLIAAGRAAWAGRFLAGSVAFPLAGDSAAAVEDHERAVLAADGVVLRYGRFYGPAPTTRATRRRRRRCTSTRRRAARSRRSTRPAGSSSSSTPRSERARPAGSWTCLTTRAISRRACGS